MPTLNASPKSSQASSGYGGTRYMRLVTCVAAPRGSAGRAANCRRASGRAPTRPSRRSAPAQSRSAASRAAAPAAASPPAPRLLQQVGGTHVATADEALLVSVPAVMLARASIASAKLPGCSSPAPSAAAARGTRRPGRARARPLPGGHAHAPSAVVQRAVSTGCSPTSRAAVPAPIPALTALHTPPR